jgi:hypothetical protein
VFGHAITLTHVCCHTCRIVDTERTEELQPRTRTVVLRVVDSQQVMPEKEATYAFACAPEAETLADVLNGFALCFPMYEITRACNQLGEAVDCDETVRVTSVFVHTVSGNELRAIPEMPVVPAVFPRAQFQVANGLYNVVCAQLERDGKCVGDYSSLSCVVLVPKFNSLKQQTEERIQACAGLAGADESFQVSVELYPNTSSQHRMQTLLQEIRSRKHPDKLYVFVVDECHYAPSTSAIPALHDADVRALSNVVVVLVSATPYNCISTRSRIPADNIVEWSSLVDRHATPNYIGFEHYFRSITFALPATPDSGQLRLVVVAGDLGVKTTVNLAECDHKRDYADHETLAAVITQRLRDCRVPLTCACGEDGKICFRRSGRDRDLKTPLFICVTPLMRALGFPAGASFPAGTRAVVAPEPHQLGDDVPLVSQHMRQDSPFSVLYEAIVAKCDHLKRFNVKTTVKLTAEWKDEWRGLQAHRPPVTLDNKKMMSAKNGFTIILDYILSLAYYGSCRLDRFDPDATTCLLKSLSPVEHQVQQVTDDMSARFLKMAAECCYFYDDRSSQACNIADALNAALEKMYRSAHEEMKAQGEPDQADCLRHILSQKMKSELKHKTTSEDQSWYTETDRIVCMLLTERRTAPMVLMRVYDKDENVAMQIVLRHALQVCGLTREGKRRVPAFSVISDTSETSLLTQIEDHFRYDYNVGEGEGRDELHVNDIVARREQAASEAAAAAGTVRKANPDLKYEDLLNIPCLIILCEKGRMGDTFPHTLRTLDLRLRTGGTASCFLQEIGRMCRYPRTEGSEAATTVAEAETCCKRASHGVTVSAASTQQFLGVARTAADVERIVRSASPPTDYPVLLARMVHPLPYALIDPAVMEAIRKAVNQREASPALLAPADGGAAITHSAMSERRRTNRIIEFLKMSRGLDSYLSSKTMMREPLQYKLKPKAGHYDATDKLQGQHLRRFLLSAECQVGKTGAYLHFLSLLRSAITVLPGDGQHPPVPPLIPLGAPWHRWLIPRFDDLNQQPNMLYDFPKTGKYHRCLAHQRLAQLQSLIATQHGGGGEGSFKQRFIGVIQEYECTVTERGRRKLDLLPEYPSVPPAGHVGDDWILDFVNWDGRFVRDGVWHTCRDELLSAFEQWQGQWQGGAVNVPLAQSVMFGEHPSVTLLAAEQDGLEGQGDGPASPAAALVSVPLSDDLNVNCRAKTVAEYQLTARLVPPNNGVTIELDNFFTVQATQNGDYHRPVGTCSVKLSVPPGVIVPASQVPLHSSRANSLSAKFGFLLKTPGKIKHWVFTPTFSGTPSVGPQDKLLMRDDAYALPSGSLKRWEDYGEVLLVRACQLQDYQRFYGGTHIIATMPDSMQYVDAQGLPGPVLSAKDHGCGYSRRFGQLLANYLGLQRVWMIDDYVLKCWQIVCKDKNSTRSNVQVQSATFATVMMHIESLFDTESTSPYPHFDERAGEALEEANKDALSEIVGAAEQYGVVGMWRGYQWRDDVAHPIKKSYSVYSFFLLNVEATVSRGLYFPARPIWEDIEFNNLLDEHRLLVCKLQVFAHEKKVHSPAIEWPQLPLEVPTLFTRLRDAGYHVCGGALYYESIMTLPAANTVLIELELILPPEPLQGPVTFLTAAHNASIFQQGALAGLEHECTLQACVHKVINESTVLGHAVDRAAAATQPVQWLLLVPRAETVTHVDADLATLNLACRDLSVSFQLLTDITGEPVIIVLATLSKQSSAAATLEITTAPMELDEAVLLLTQPPLSQPLPSPSNFSPLPSPAVRGPRGQTRRREANGADKWITDHAKVLMEELRSRGRLLGDSRAGAIDDIFGRALPTVNQLGAQLTEAMQLYDRCRKTVRNEQRRRASSREGTAAPHHTEGGANDAALRSSAGGEAAIEGSDAALQGVDEALQGEGDAHVGGAFSEGEGEHEEEWGNEGDDSASPAKRSRHI